MIPKYLLTVSAKRDNNLETGKAAHGYSVQVCDATVLTGAAMPGKENMTNLLFMILYN